MPPLKEGAAKLPLAVPDELVVTPFAPMAELLPTLAGEDTVVCGVSLGEAVLFTIPDDSPLPTELAAPPSVLEVAAPELAPSAPVLGAAPTLVVPELVVAVALLGAAVTPAGELVPARTPPECWAKAGNAAASATASSAARVAV